MFFSYHILVRKNSNFSLVWRYMHDKKKVSRKELLQFDVVSACNDLRGYIPTGSLSMAELQNKMSLYLLSQLVYGISLVHSYQALTLQHFSSEIARGLMRSHREEPVKRKVVDEDYDTERDDDDQGDVPAAKRKRVSKRASSILDLNDPRSYVCERPNRTSTVMEPLFDADDMFQVPGLPEVGLEPAEEFMKMQEEVSNFRSQDIKIEPGEDMKIDVSLKDMKVSVGRYDDWQPPLSDNGTGGDAIENVRARTMSSHLSVQETLKTSMLFDDSTHQPPHVSPPPASPPPPPPLPIYRQIESLESQDEFELEPLPEFARPLEPKRRKRRLIYDDVMILTSEQISDQMKHYDDLVLVDEAIALNKLSMKKMSLNSLFHPRPWHIDYLHTDLMSLFDTALNQPKPTISFGEANKYGIEELRQRYWDRLGFDVKSWTSEALNDTLVGAAGDAPHHVEAQAAAFENFEPIIEVMPPAPEVDDHSFTLLSQAAAAEKAAGFEPEDEEDRFMVPMKVSVAEISEFAPEKTADSDIEARRLSSLAASRVSLPFAHFDDFDQPLQNDDANLVRTPTKTAYELSQRTLESPEATDLYQELVEMAGSGICKFNDVMSRNCTKQLAAKKFYNLLCLLKQKEVKVKQIIAYGDILVRLAPVH